MFYANIDENKKVTEVFNLSTPVKADNFIQIPNYDSVKIGQTYVDGNFVDMPETAETPVETPPEVVTSPVETVTETPAPVVTCVINAADVLEIKTDLAGIAADIATIGGYFSTLSNKLVDIEALAKTIDGHFVTEQNTAATPETDTTATTQV